MKTEPIGSIPRSPALIQAMQAFSSGAISRDAMDAAATARDTAFSKIRVHVEGTPLAVRELGV